MYEALVRQLVLEKENSEFKPVKSFNRARCLFGDMFSIMESVTQVQNLDEALEFHFAQMPFGKLWTYLSFPLPAKC